MRARRATLTTLAVALLLPIVGGAASADVEWCDSGSPPPNDFRFRMTGAPSSTSSMSWLNSTTGGTLDLASYPEVNTLEGGVAKGMWTAIANAPSAYDTQVKDRASDDDKDDDDKDDKEEDDEEDGEKDKDD